MKNSLTSNTWAPAPLSELVADTRSGFASGDRDDAGIIQIRMNNVDTSGALNLTQATRVPASRKQIEEFSLRPGDVLFNNTNSTDLVGKTAVFLGHREPVVFSNHFTRVRVKSDILEPRYLGRWLTYQQQRKVFTGLCTRWVNQSAVRTDKLLGLKIPLPPLAEQKRIADILDKADAIRRKRQEAVRMAKEALLTSTFRAGLGDPHTNPHRWPIEKLGNVITFVGGSQPPKSTFVNAPRPGYVRLIQIRDFKTDKYPTYIPAELAKRPFKSDDVMIARYGPPVFQILRGLEGSYNVALMKAEPTKRTTKDFIFHLLQIPEIHDVVVAHSERTAGQSGTNLDLLKNLEVPIPPIESQLRLNDEMRLIEGYIASTQTHQDDADGLFYSLVQRAFRGNL
ncbi:restriction endonuclease subunit S [Planctomicrobium sp. SH664]|uniref:restriction endonuclease subunit S n=1 Tax=Planctomicrobium sp. SH664 TaxID=3448125 RepID=UPI003F5B1E88